MDMDNQTGPETSTPAQFDSFTSELLARLDTAIPAAADAPDENTRKEALALLEQAQSDAGFVHAASRKVSCVAH